VASSNNTLIVNIFTNGGNQSGMWIGAVSAAPAVTSIRSLRPTPAAVSTPRQPTFTLAPPSRRRGNNTLVILSNSVFALGPDSIPLTVGRSSTNNTLSLLAGTVVNAGLNGGAAGQGLKIGGFDNSATNVLLLNGALVTNTGPVTVGSGSGGSSVGNQLLIYNGAIVSNVNALTVGGAFGANYNNLFVTNGGKFYQNSGAVGIGATTAGGTGGGNNTVLLSNSVLVANAASYIGVGSSNNSVTLLPNTTWNQGNTALTIGSVHRPATT